ncbi:baseplate hub subunit [Vibrio phage nt-1]|uniref:Baseplate hub subunit n=1 Tax=Vibrio phage nt-1 TaxID=115992 RepID=R9TFZ1_9CAUD|nr:baseplate hub subunit [Vibrio phage nt-1]AGN30379.1 baseplate hub subunit [Vibrio phage nt-1]
MTKAFDISVLAAPQYTVTLPSTGEEVKLRAMLAKEHKALLIANESDAKVDAIEQCLENCIVSDIKMEDLSVGDAEYLFIHMYMNSNGVSEIKAEYNCCADKPEEELQALSEEEEAELEKTADDLFAEIMQQSDEEAIEKVLAPDKHLCGEKITAFIDLNAAFVPEFNGENLVKVNKNVAIILKHPGIRVYENNDPNTPQGLFNIAVESIHEVHVGDTVYTKEELAAQEKLVDIMGELDTAAFKKVQSFVDSVPRVTTHIDVTCPKCGNHEKVTLQGIEDFFV